MTCRYDSAAVNRSDHDKRHNCQKRRGFLYQWFIANSIISGFFALCWLILRSGPKPSRFAYPCQQVALSAATLAFGVPLVSAIIAGRRRLVAGLRTPTGMVAAAAGLALTAGMWGYLAQAEEYSGPLASPRGDYRARVFHVTDNPQQPDGDHFVGLDNLIRLMGRKGLKFYDSATQTMESGPGGVVGTNDVIILKINYQWPQRGGTNTDLLRGVIRRIVDHPDTFAGEVIVCENTQFNSAQDLNMSSNNAEDHGQSPRDVVMDFRNAGHAVSHYVWTLTRLTSVTEYSTGNDIDGYVVGNYNGSLGGRVSYPKFRTVDGTRISLKYGIWDPSSQTYDLDHLKFINLPVLKSHHATYGATACVKHYMGVVSGELGTNSHGAIRNGILGALMADIRPADLNILDCTWINANPNDGPWTTYAGATRRDELVASLDPVAADIWAVKNILIPAFYENGYSPPWPLPSADPDNPNSDFRVYLDRSMNYIQAAGFDATNDFSKIDVFHWDGVGVPSDVNGDGIVTLVDYPTFHDCMSSPNTDPAPSLPMTVADCLDLFDRDLDGDVDMSDYHGFAERFGADDCNRNGVADADDVDNGNDADCNADGIPDACEIADGTSEDCNGNSVPDGCDVALPLPLLNDALAAVHGFVDIVSTGTPLDLSDDGHADVTMPFSTTLFPTPEVRVANNGGVGFGAVGSLVSTNVSVPSAGVFDGAQALLPYWDDLDADTGNVFYETIGIEPDRTFIVQWDDRPHYEGDTVLDGDEVTFQIQLFETPIAGVAVQFVYADTFFRNSNYDYGRSATVGYQESGSEAVQWSFNQAGTVPSDLLLSIVATPSSADCNENRAPDSCDIDDGSSTDTNGNGVPDECE